MGKIKMTGIVYPKEKKEWNGSGKGIKGNNCPKIC